MTYSRPKSAEDIVHELFSMPGPYDRDTTVRAAAVLDQLVRYLNLATRFSEALPWPAAAADLAGLLKASTEKLPQVLTQTSRRLAEFQQMPELINYGGRDRDSVQSHDDAVQHIDQARTALDLAVSHAAALALQLAAAQDALSSVQLNLSDGELEDDE